MTTHQLDRQFMDRALELAARSPLADPNPRVGCVIVAPDGAVLGEGWHRGAGTPHAEVEALRRAGTKAGGATAYVTLEPCDHTGRTGPCTQALMGAGISRVVFAQADPNPSAAGGARTLLAAGLDVSGGLAASEAFELNRYWTFSVTNRRQFVTWKVAATLDGRTAADDGTSTWITGAAARADVHRLRAEAGAIVVGTGTVLVDDPQLTVRLPDGSLAERQPLRVVLGHREIPPDARVLGPDAETWCTPAPLPDVLSELHARGIHHLWLEGGATLAASFVKAGLVDRIVAYLAPALLGSGKPLLGDLGIRTITDINRYLLDDVTRLDDDVRLTLTRNRPTNSPTNKE